MKISLTGAILFSDSVMTLTLSILRKVRPHQIVRVDTASPWSRHTSQLFCCVTWEPLHRITSDDY